MAKGKRRAGRKRATARKVKKSVSKKAKAKRKAPGKAVKKKAAARKKSSKKAAAKNKPAKKAKAAKKPAVSGKFNLIVTFDPTHVGTAQNELNEVLKKIGEKPRIEASEVEGLFKVAVSDARRVVGRLRELCKADPNLFVATHHYTPVDVWCKSDVAQMQKNIKPLALGIGASEKWKMSLNKRRWDKSGATELIIKLTEVIERENVDLTSPQKIVQVEVIGKEAGISLLTPKELFDVAEIKGRA